jgi:hypothetical protein
MSIYKEFHSKNNTWHRWSSWDGNFFVLSMEVNSRSISAYLEFIRDERTLQNRKKQRKIFKKVKAPKVNLALHMVRCCDGEVL